MKHVLKKTTLIISFLACMPVYAFNSAATEQQADSEIKKLYHKLKNKPNSSMMERIDWFSKQFIGIPYVLSSLGEGPQARYDQFPRYRVDGFDCDTYVNTVISLALTKSLSSFQQCINHMRYIDGHVSYIQRTHFNGLDWNPYHQRDGLFKDITFHIKNKQNQPVAQWANAKIEKSNWYAFKTQETIRLQHADEEKKKKRLDELKAKGSTLKTEMERVPYVPLTALFPKDDKPDMSLFAQIPHGAIIEIVRPNWDLRAQIGTALNISHLGFAIRDDKNQLYFREASSEYGKIVDVPLANYLRNALNSPTIKGINIQVIVPQQPSAIDCGHKKIVTPNINKQIEDTL